jgi:hypothetical protein
MYVPQISKDALSAGSVPVAIETGVPEFFYCRADGFVLDTGDRCYDMDCRYGDHCRIFQESIMDGRCR